MDHVKGLGMKGPLRPAPAVPGFPPNRYSPVTNWNDDPFGSDVFEPSPAFRDKKKPPPRPPPPKIKQPHIPNKPSHFIRKPTILTSLMSKKEKPKIIVEQNSMEFQNESLQKIFQKCEVRNTQTASLIDFSSPPSSPTFTTRSSSDGLSVDSFGSDVTSSTNQHRTTNGNQSQAESGFEDDFDLFISTRKPITKDDTLDDFANFDPFSPPPKPVIKSKPIGKLSDQFLCNGKTVQSAVQTYKMPTIIRAKPTRPKPPDTTALLKTTFTQPIVPMNLNMSKPIERVNTACDYYSTNLNTIDWSPERESSPPMPSVPPPPPPEIDPSDIDQPLDTQEQVLWSTSDDSSSSSELPNIDQRYRAESNAILNIREGSCDCEPYAIALYDYPGNHPEDLSFKANTIVKLIRRIDEEWLYGRLRNGAEGMFPANYVEIKEPLPGETCTPPQIFAKAVALYDFQPSHPGDLTMRAGDEVTVINKINEEWHFGECNGVKGQFPSNYVQFR